MQFTVSSDDIQHSAELLEYLKKWERIRDIAQEYNAGEVTFLVKGNKGVVSAGINVDRYSLSNQRARTPVEKCHREIGYLIGAESAKLAETICQIIRNHMPLPLEPQP